MSEAVTTISGAEAEVRWAYLRAAALSQWHFEGNRSGGTLTATVVSVDTFRLSQQPLTFVVLKQGKPWSWPVMELSRTGEALIAKLGPFVESS